MKLKCFEVLSVDPVQWNVGDQKTRKLVRCSQ